jgi:hypothetical protein
MRITKLIGNAMNGKIRRAFGDCDETSEVSFSPDHETNHFTR